MAILIQASHVAFAHGGNQIFTDVTFELKDGDRIVASNQTPASGRGQGQSPPGGQAPQGGSR